MAGRPNQGLNSQARVWLSEAQDSRIEAISEKTGATKSEIIRQALDARLDSISLELVLSERMRQIEASVAALADEAQIATQAVAALEAAVLELGKLVCFALPSPENQDVRKRIAAAGAVRWAEYQKQVAEAKARFVTPESGDAS